MGWKVVSSPFIPIVTERAISVLLNHLSLFTSSKKSKVSVCLAPEGKVCQGWGGLVPNSFKSIWLGAKNIYIWMNSGFLGLLFGVTWQCCTCQAAIRDFQVVSHYLSSMCFHSVAQIIKLDHFIFIPLVACFEQSGGSDHILLVFWNLEKG